MCYGDMAMLIQSTIRMFVSGKRMDISIQSINQTDCTSYDLTH